MQMQKKKEPWELDSDYYAHMHKTHMVTERKV